jgi:hypothetical protein
MNWEDRTQTIKGNLGERIIDDYLKSKGLIPYHPDFQGAHPFDRLCSTPDKKYLCIVDSKAKARRTYYPDTGIDTRTWREYRYLQDKYAIDVWLFFIDEDMGTVYGEKLRNLENPITVTWNNRAIEYPKIETNRFGREEIYFSVDSMKTIYSLNAEQVAELKQHSTRTYEYFSEKGSN